MLNTSAPMLEGIRIIDLTTVVFGPYCTQILSDLGAEVIKVETKTGDTFRWSGKWAKTKAMSPGHMTLNRGKKSIVLDLKDEEDAETMRKLIAGADVFIHNIRSEAIKRLDFDYVAMKELNKELIYVHCVGFGSGGPYSDLQAYDDVIQAATGTTSLLSRVDGNPRQRYIPSLIADKVAGLHAAYATQAAIIHKLRTGRGQHVEVPMFEAFASFMMKEHLGGLTFDPPVGEEGYTRQLEPDRQPFPASDGYVSIVPYEATHMVKVVALLGDQAYQEDERFATMGGIARNMPEIYRKIAELTQRYTTAECIELMRANGIPAMEARDLSTILEDEHLQAVDFFHRREHPTEGAYFQMQEPSKFGDWQRDEQSPPPLLGEHSEDLRAEALDQVAMSKASS